LTWLISLPMWHGEGFIHTWEHYQSRDSGNIFGIVSRLSAGAPKNCGSVPIRSQIFFSSSKCPDRSCGTNLLLSGGTVLPRVKRLECGFDNSCPLYAFLAYIKNEITIFFLVVKMKMVKMITRTVVMQLNVVVGLGERYHMSSFVRVSGKRRHIAKSVLDVFKYLNSRHQVPLLKQLPLTSF